MKKCSILSNTSLLDEPERIYKKFRDYNLEYIFEEDFYEQSVSPSNLNNAETAEEYLSDSYSIHKKILKLHQKKTSHSNKETPSKKTLTERRSKTDSNNETVDIADDFEMMKEKYQKWKKKMVLES